MKKKIGYIFLTLIFLPCLFLLSACGGSADFKINFVVDGVVYDTIETQGNTTISMPDDPEKQGYTFDGWYWDKDIWNEPFTANSLLNTPLKKDMNVYAKFVNLCVHVESEWSTVSSPTCINNGLEKKVCLLCGELIETRVINATGHTFGDWYVSKDPTLTEKGTEKRDCNNCTYSETRDIPKLIIENPTQVNVEFGIIKWDGSSPFGFDVVVNGTSHLVNANQLETELKSDDYNEIKVASINADGTKSEYVELKDFVVNLPISNLHYTDDGTNVTFTWDSPSDLYDYTFIIGETENTIDKTKHSYTVARSSLVSGSVISVYVQGLTSANFYPSKKNTILLQQLDAPNLSIDKLNIVWNYVSCADNYKVEALTTKTITNTTYSYDGASAGEYTITVTAFGADYLNNSSTLTFNKLTRPEVTIENNVVSWNEIAGQVRYATLIGDNETTFKGNSYPITNTEDEYDIYLYAFPVQANTMQSDRVIISKFTYGEYSTVYCGIITNTTPTYTKVAYNNSIYVPNQYIDNINLSNVNSSITLIASKLPTGLTKTLVTNIIIPDGTTEIKSYAFSYCSNATSVSIPESVEVVREKTFLGCFALTEVYIANLVKWCGVEIFDDYGPLSHAKNLYLNGNLVEHLTIPAEVTIIRSCVFSHLTCLKSVSFKENYLCSFVAQSAFRNCSNLTRVYITNITRWFQIEFGSNPFSYMYLNNELVENLIVPKGITKIQSYAFAGMSLKSVIFEDGAQCESIGEYAFAGCDMVNLDIPNSVKKIGQYAFCNCSNLNSVFISDSVTSIGASVFYNCSSLAKITMSLTSMDSKKMYLGYLFGFNSYEKNEYVPKSLKEFVITGGTEIASYMFYGCTGISNISIPSSVEKIGSSAFYNCTNLTFNNYDNAYYLGNDDNKFVVLMETISTDIEQCEINNNCKVIYNGAFSGCSSLINIILPENITSIGEYAFAECSRFSKIIIPQKVKSIGKGAFYGCSNVTTITIPFIENKTDKLDVVSVFGSNHLYTVIITGGTKIGSYAFNGCGLQKVIIPTSITCIGDCVFNGCYSGMKIYYMGTSEQWSKITISEDNILMYNIYYYSEEEPPENIYGNFWHYVDGVITEWERE